MRFWDSCILQLAETLELLWRLAISEFICIKIHEVHAHAVFHFAFTEIVQKQLPMPMLLQIFGDMFGKQNVPGIAAIHHPLRHINSRPGHAGLIVYIDNCAHRTAVHAHSQGQIRMRF